MWKAVVPLVLVHAATAFCPAGAPRVLPARHQRRRGADVAISMGTGNSFGRLFRISTWGESHGGGVGVTIDGCPPRVPLRVEDIQAELDRRRPGQSRLTTPRNEEDKVRWEGMGGETISLAQAVGDSVGRSRATRRGAWGER